MVAGIEQYTPGPVPNTGNAELERYVSDELERIRNALPVDTYGGLYINTAKICTNAGTTPLVLSTANNCAWSGVNPNKPEGATMDATNGTITLGPAGVYFCSARIAALISASSCNYYTDLFINGAATSIRGFVYGAFEPGTGTYASVHMEVSGIIDVPANAVCDLRYSVQNTVATRIFWIGNADWSMQRIGG